MDSFSKMEAVITIPSTRVYLDELPDECAESVVSTALIYSAAKEKLYNMKYDNTFVQEDAHPNPTAEIKEYLLNIYKKQPQDYYITSLMSHVGGMISSQKELSKMYDNDLKLQVENIDKKIKELQSKEKILRKAKESLIVYYKKHMPRKEETKNVKKTKTTLILNPRSHTSQ